MDTKGFKVGDKVKLKYPYEWKLIGDITGEISKFTPPYIRVNWEGNQNWMKNYPHLPKEIECVAKVGEQLVFNFMLGE